MSEKVNPECGCDGRECRAIPRDRSIDQGDCRQVVALTVNAVAPLARVVMVLPVISAVFKSITRTFEFKEITFDDVEGLGHSPI